MAEQVQVVGGKLDGITGVVNIKAEPPLKVESTICHWAPPQFTDKGQTVLHTVLSVVSFAVALWSAGEQMRIFNMRNQLADAYAAIAEEEWNRFNTKYRPLENDMIAECLAEKDYFPDYDEAEATYSGLIEDDLERGSAFMTDMARRYALCIDRSLLSGLASEASSSRADFVNYGYRDMEWYTQHKRDYRFNKRSNLLNLGRNLISQSAKYGGLADSILQGAAAAQAAATNGAMYFLGYIRNRNEPMYLDYVTGGVPAQGTAQPFVPQTSMMSVDTTVG
jgi:hypothetical protein